MSHWPTVRAQLALDAVAAVPGAAVFFDPPLRTIEPPCVVFSYSIRRDPNHPMAGVRTIAEVMDITCEIRLPVPGGEGTHFGTADAAAVFAERIEPTTIEPEPLATWSPYAGVGQHATVTNIEAVPVSDEVGYVAGRVSFSMVCILGK